MLNLVLPKGSLEAETLRLFEDADLPVVRSSDVDYRAAFAAIDASGYQGWIGCEYRPRAGTLPGLAWRERLGLVAF